MNRVTYLVYYFKKLDWKKFNTFFSYVRKNYNYSKFGLWKDILTSSFTYNISLLDYFYFRFFELHQKQRETYAGTGYMYEYQLQMNPVKSRNILENKLLFLRKYSKFIKHRYWRKEEVQQDVHLVDELVRAKSKIILKSSDGQCGEGIQLLDLKTMESYRFVQFLASTENDLIEEFIVQHDELMKLSPAGLNTVRIFTQLDKNDHVVFLGARLRITVDSYVDNLAAGNIAASINIQTGIVDQPGVYSDITKNDESVHPITKVAITGFKVPYWKEIVAMVTEAALLFPENRSIGWDVAVTNEGPELLEGNHNWCKLLWQLPVKKGLKHELETYV